MGELKREYSATFKVNLAQLVAIVLQVGAFIWFAATQTAIVSQHTAQISENKAQIKIVSDSVTTLIKDVAEMKGKQEYQTNVLDNINQVVMSRSSSK